MSDRIFIFTQSFPYGKEETFIKEEIQFMLKYFDKVLIISNTKSNEIRNFLSQLACIQFHTINLNLKILYNFFWLYFLEGIIFFM